jgi:hypothetical protein
MERFALGSRDVETIPLWAYRRSFLDAILLDSPQVLEALKQVLPLMQRLAEAEQQLLDSPGLPAVPSQGTAQEITEINLTDKPGTLPDTLGAWKKLTYSVLVYAEAGPCAEAVRVWSERFRLVDEWVLDIAVSTLEVWVNEPESAGDRVWRYPQLLTMQPLAHDETQLQITVQWDAPFESWDGFKKRLDAYVGKELSKYKSQIERLVAERGWKTVPVRQQEHFRWLVQYQVRGWSAKQIADRQQRNLKAWENTVSKAVKTTAQRIGLTLREPKKGKHLK